MDRLFLDANILVSAALKPGSRLAGLWRLAGVRLLASPHVIAEARRNVTDPEAAERLEQRIAALVVLPTEPADFPIPDDPGLPEKDRPVLLGAIVSGADFLLTGDLSHFSPCMGRTVGGVRVLLPGDYLRTRARTAPVTEA
jgi:predicted nucleic acid-binding protein